MNDTDRFCGDGGMLVIGRGNRNRSWFKMAFLVGAPCLAAAALMASSGNSVAAAGVERSARCAFPDLPNAPRTRACYSVRASGVETIAWSRTDDLRQRFNCPGAPVITGGASQSVAFVSSAQPVKVFGAFPVLETRSAGRTSSSGFARFGDEYSGLQFPSTVTVVRNAHGDLLEEDPDPETACSGGPVPVRHLVSADCGTRVFRARRVIVSWNGPGRFKVFLGRPWQPYRRCDLGGEALGGELVEWIPIYFAGSNGRPVNRSTLYRTRTGRTVTFRGSYRRQHQYGAEIGQVTLSFKRLS
jgi:hypothetical protein